MAIRHRFLLLIHSLCCVAIINGNLLDVNDAETCNLLCGQCNASAVFVNDRCECSFTDNNDEGAECIQRIQREIQAIDLNALSDDLTDEERSVRSIFKSRRRLRLGDADKVAQYFVNGGPAAGHSHFIRAFNAALDSADSTTNSFSGADDENPENGFHGAPLISPVSRSTYDSPLYMVPEEDPQHAYSNGVEMYHPTLGAMNSAVTYPAGGWYDPETNLWMSPIIHPRRSHEHRLPLHHTSLKRPGLSPHAVHKLLLHHTPHHTPHHYYPAYHSGIRSADPYATSFVGQPISHCENSDVPDMSLTARNNADKPIEHNVAASFPDPVQYSPQMFRYDTHVAYQPMEYRHHFPYEYSYYSPLLNILYPMIDRYYLQPVTHYMQDTADPIITASNPNSYCTNNPNTEQQSTASTITDKTVYTNDRTQMFNNVMKDNINTFKKEKKMEKDGINNS